MTPELKHAFVHRKAQTLSDELKATKVREEKKWPHIAQKGGAKFNLTTRGIFIQSSR